MVICDYQVEQLGKPTEHVLSLALGPEFRDGGNLDVRPLVVLDQELAAEIDKPDAEGSVADCRGQDVTGFRPKPDPAWCASAARTGRLTLVHETERAESCHPVSDHGSSEARDLLELATSLRGP